MNPELARELNALFDAAAQTRPSSAEFQVAYQSRVVMDRIRFAIRVTDQSPATSINSAKLACSCWMLWIAATGLIAGFKRGSSQRSGF